MGVVAVKTCATCRHWGYAYDNTPRRECRALPNVTFALVEDYLDELAIIERDSEPAGLATLGAFGCILHEEKEG